MSQLFQDKKFAFQRISDKKWLNVWIPINLTDEFDPVICYSARNIIEEDFAFTKLNRNDFELKTINITYTL